MTSDPLDQKLRQLMGEVSVVAPPPPTLSNELPRHRTSRHPNRVLLAAAGVLLLLVGAGALTLWPRDSDVVVETSTGLGQPDLINQPEDGTVEDDSAGSPSPSPATATSVCPSGFPLAQDTDGDGVIDTCYSNGAPTAIPAPPIVDPSSQAPAADEAPFYHTVKTGDRLGSIASKYNVTVDVIIRANPQMNPNLIIAGERLVIPGAAANLELFEDVGPDRPDGVTVNYVVQAGDTLGGIATTWTVSLEALLATNPQLDPSALQVNQVLVIPPWGTGLAASDLQPRGAAPVEHVIEAGDFISEIAARYGITIQQIVDANGLENAGNSLQIGQVLLIPPPESEP